MGFIQKFLMHLAVEFGFFFDPLKIACKIAKNSGFLKIILFFRQDEGLAVGAKLISLNRDRRRRCLRVCFRSLNAWDAVLFLLSNMA